jgi:glutamate receptor ionotropic, NMDA 2B
MIYIYVYIYLIAGKREYLRAINSAVTGLTKSRGQKLTFLKDYEFNPSNIHFESLTLNPSPTAILTILCKQFLHQNGKIKLNNFFLT